MKTEELARFLAEKIETDKGFLFLVETHLIERKDFGMAAVLRDMEFELFPVDESVRAEKERGIKLNLLFRMVELNVPVSTCWLVDQAIKEYDKKGDNFSIDDATALVVKRKELFG